MIKRKIIGSLLLLALGVSAWSQESHHVSRAWMEALLNGIRNDYARPTIHARNLFHTSIAMYDAWAAYDPTAETYLLGKTHGDFQSEFDPTGLSQNNVKAQQHEAMSYAAYRLTSFRFATAPGQVHAQAYFDSLMNHYGYDIHFNSIDYQSGNPAALGNYLATEIIRYGLQDGANEQNAYTNEYYQPVNEPLVITNPGNPGISDPNRWQPIAFDVYIDQAGNLTSDNIPPFLSPEWGNVHGFSLNPEHATVKTRAGHDYLLYHQLPNPPHLGASDEATAAYQWGFELVALWSGHLSPSDSVMWDISPGGIGNVQHYPDSFQEYKEFYKSDGGEGSTGHDLNPVTEKPYTPQIVPRGDYTRVLAEFWADGPDSETPPGHWFTILNYVMDHPQFAYKMNGKGQEMDPVAYETKSYFTLAAAMHDVAITTWAIKGWYDYIRPVSAIRYMAEKGQCTDDALPNYDPHGLPLIQGQCELVTDSDPLAGESKEHSGKIKIKTWRGPNYISNPETDHAEVGWILAENWWPYQRPTFVTPPFAGYISGHSTYSRAAAEVLTWLTGSRYFPGGLGEFHAPKNEFLVFEEGPSVDVTLQWATYQDASDQCSLSRIYGGIHPPADDIPGRILGAELAGEVCALAEKYFINNLPLIAEARIEQSIQIFPNPVLQGNKVQITSNETIRHIEVFSSNGQLVLHTNANVNTAYLTTEPFQQGIYYIRVNGRDSFRMIIQ